jgi:hypothetical protein
MTDVDRSDVDGLILADLATLPDAAALPSLVDRLGLLDPIGGLHDTAITLQFGGTDMLLSAQTSSPALQDPVASRGIGDVSTAPPDSELSLRICLEQPDRASGRHIQQVQHLCAAAAMIAEACGAERMYWPPARLWSPVTALAEAVAASEAQGLPPVLHLVAFLPEDGAVVTRGLAYLCGIELRLTCDVPMALPEMVRRLARLAVHAMLVGPLAPGASVAGLEPGELILVSHRDERGPAPCINLQLQRAR